MLQEKMHNQISIVGTEAFLSCIVKLLVFKMAYKSWMHEAMVLSSRGWIKENKCKKILIELCCGKKIKCTCYQLF